MSKALTIFAERCRDEETYVSDTQDPPLGGGPETPALKAVFVAELLHESLSGCVRECSFKSVMRIPGRCSLQRSGFKFAPPEVAGFPLPFFPAASFFLHREGGGHWRTGFASALKKTYNSTESGLYSKKITFFEGFLDKKNFFCLITGKIHLY